jgi:hypothetical protein
MGAVLWRVVTVPFYQLWRDWVFLLAVYGLYSHFRRTCREWPVTTASMMAFMLGLYWQGQFLHVLSVLGLNQ